MADHKNEKTWWKKNLKEQFYKEKRNSDASDQEIEVEEVPNFNHNSHKIAHPLQGSPIITPGPLPPRSPIKYPSAFTAVRDPFGPSTSRLTPPMHDLPLGTSITPSMHAHLVAASAASTSAMVSMGHAFHPAVFRHAESFDQYGIDTFRQHPDLVESYGRDLSSSSSPEQVERPDDPDKRKRKQKCQRCKNHGHEVEVKGHKWDCPFRKCTCHKCFTIAKKQESMRQQKQINRQNEPIPEPRPDASENNHIEKDFHGLDEMTKELKGIICYELYDRIAQTYNKKPT